MAQSKDARAYYKGAHRVMLGGVPCRIPNRTDDLSGLLKVSSRAMSERSASAMPSWWSALDRQREKVRRIKAEVASYAAALGISETIARKRIAAQSAILAPMPESIAC